MDKDGKDAYTYDVFLSYRHKPLDTAVTQKAFHILESYRLPAALAKRGLGGVRRAFRDNEELAVSRILSGTIDAALRSTDCLVVLCSPDTPDSAWVDREVATFIELGRADRIYPLLIAGDPTVSFPPSLGAIPDIGERTLDVRTPGDHPSKIVKNARAALLRVIAAVGGCPEAELIRRDKMRAIRRALLRRFGAAAVFALVALVSLQLWFAAERYRREAVTEQHISMSILRTLTYALPDHLVELPRTFGAVSSILADNALQIEEILSLSADQWAVLPEIAANKERFATAMLTLGDYRLSAESQEQAVDLYRQLVLHDGRESMRLASSSNNLGAIREATGDFAGAVTAYEEAIRIAEVSGVNPADDADARLERATYLGNLATALIRAGDAAGAQERFEAADTMLVALSEQGYQPAKRALATNLNNLGVMLYQQGRYAASGEALTQSLALAEELFQATPNRTLLGEQARSQISLASCYALQAKFDEALVYYRAAVEAQEILADDPDNISAQNALAVLYNNYGLCFNMAGDYDRAGVWFGKNTELQESIFERTQTPLAQAMLARSCYNVAENAFKGGNYSLSKTYYDRCLAWYAPVSEELGVYHRGEYLARLAYYQILFTQDFSAALANAAAAVDLLPESSFVCYIFGYALLYNDLTDACDQVFAMLASRSAGETVNVRLDFEALTRAGLAHPHMSSVLDAMDAMAQAADSAR